MANLSATPIRMEAGGIITITDASTDYVLLMLQPGTLRIKEGGFESLTYTDRGALQAPLEGDEQLSEIELDAKFSGSASASHLHYVLTQAGTAGAMRLFTFKAQWRDNKPAATGHQVTFTNCFVPTGSMPEITAGVQWDTIKMRLQSIEPKGTWATF